MALPMIIAMLVQALYNVVDSIYVSRISESAVTALSLAFPVQNLLIGFAVGIGVGVNSLLSKALGQGDQNLANRTAGNGIALGASFQALGNGIYSTVASLCRQLIALLPAAYLLSLSGNVTLVWWSFPIAEIISVTVTLLLFRKIYHQKIRPLYQA